MTIRFAGAAFVLALAAPAAAAPPPAAVAVTPAPAAVGANVPAFAARDVTTGAPIDASTYAGKILVVNFWATWCPPCRAETPDMIRAFRSLGGASDVAFLGIDTTESAPVVKTFLSAKGVPYRIALAGPDAYNAFGIAYIPTTIVLDAHGIVRARWTGELAPERLAAFVTDARNETNYAIDTPDERTLAALLDPAGYTFAGDAAVAAPQIARATANVAVADAFVDAHADPGNVTIDYTATQTLEGGLLARAAAAEIRLAKTPDERAAADRTLAAADGKLDRYADAVAALLDAQRRTPGDVSLYLALAKTYYRLHDYANGIADAETYTSERPEDADGWNWLALSEQRDARYADAAPHYERAIADLIGAIDTAKTPDDRIDAIANVADTSLDLADVDAALGDVAATARAFAVANAYADRLDPKGTYAELVRNVRERTQEGVVAAHLAHGDKTALAVAPWTGADLPGSVASTIKYRLIVAGHPNATVDLRASGLRPAWIASFCTDGLCSPDRVRATLSDSGVKTYELTLVPPGKDRHFGTIVIRAGDGVTATIAAR